VQSTLQREFKVPEADAGPRASVHPSVENILEGLSVSFLQGSVMGWSPVPSFVVEVPAPRAVLGMVIGAVPKAEEAVRKRPGDLEGTKCGLAQ